MKWPIEGTRIRAALMPSIKEILAVTLAHSGWVPPGKHGEDLLIIEQTQPLIKNRQWRGLHVREAGIGCQIVHLSKQRKNDRASVNGFKVSSLFFNRCSSIIKPMHTRDTQYQRFFPLRINLALRICRKENNTGAHENGIQSASKQKKSIWKVDW